MTPERRLVTEEWITAFEQAAQNQEAYMHEHPEEMENTSTRRLLQAQLDAVLSMADDLRTQLKAGEEEYHTIWAVWADVEHDSPVAYCLDRSDAYYLLNIDQTKQYGDIIPYNVTHTEWMKLFVGRLARHGILEKDTEGGTEQGVRLWQRHAPRKSSNK